MYIVEYSLIYGRRAFLRYGSLNKITGPDGNVTDADSIEIPPAEFENLPDAEKALNKLVLEYPLVRCLVTNSTDDSFRLVIQNDIAVEEFTRRQILHYKNKWNSPWRQKLRRFFKLD